MEQGEARGSAEGGISVVFKSVEPGRLLGMTFPSSLSIPRINRVEKGESSKRVSACSERFVSPIASRLSAHTFQSG